MRSGVVEIYSEVCQNSPELRKLGGGRPCERENEDMGVSALDWVAVPKRSFVGSREWHERDKAETTGLDLVDLRKTTKDTSVFRCPVVCRLKRVWWPVVYLRPSRSTARERESELCESARMH